MLWPLRLGSLRLNGRAALAGVGICLVVSLAACTAQTESPQKPIPPLVAQPALALPAPPETSAKPSKTVRTSYQGSGTAGQPTASGEPYNPNDLTAASRNLPIGSTVKVTDSDTGRSVKVRINDRGTFVHGRSLDLSKRAAENIGIPHKGVARVRGAPHGGWLCSSAGSDHELRDLLTAVQTLSASANRAGSLDGASGLRSPASPIP